SLPPTADRGALPGLRPAGLPGVPRAFAGVCLLAGIRRRAVRRGPQPHGRRGAAAGASSAPILSSDLRPTNSRFWRFNMKRLLAAGLAGLALHAPAVSMAQAPMSLAHVDLAQALADPRRPAEQVRRDGARHPAEVLAFAGVKAGDKVADLMPGGGYF